MPEQEKVPSVLLQTRRNNKSNHTGNMDPDRSSFRNQVPDSGGQESKIHQVFTESGKISKFGGNSYIVNLVEEKVG